MIHLGHDRSVDTIVRAAVEEGVQGVAISSYQGGHVEYFYSVFISGYHIAEAGANPISQLAFTLANGFTY